MHRRAGHLLLSANRATGLSLNFPPRLTCPKTCPFCYACKRTAKQAAALCKQYNLPAGSITANAGPITWSVQQAAYAENFRLLKSMTSTEIEDEAAYQAGVLRRRGYDNLRINGCGELFDESVQLVHALARRDILAWGFSRLPGRIWEIEARAALDHVHVRPFFLGSVDRLTPDSKVVELLEATQALNRTPRTLAYMALPGERAADIKAKPFWPHVRVVLGYHSSGVHTIIRVGPRECPKTAGRGVTCQECRRCRGLSPKCSTGAMAA